MAGQNKEIFLTRNSKIFIQKNERTNTTNISLLRHFSSQRLLLILLLLQSCLLPYAAALPTPSQRPTDLAPMVDDSRETRPNTYVDIARLNQHLGLFQGDIKLSSLQQSIYEIITTRKFYPQTPLPEKMVRYWENGLIYYDTSSITDPRLLAMIELAVSTLQTQTDCLIIVPGKTSPNYIKFTENPGCWSYLGKQGGPQEIALGSGSCRSRNVIIHLMFHAIGFVHEESRPDRGLNVYIDYANVAPGKETNFEILPEELVHSNGTSYDFYSITHTPKKGSSYLSPNGYRDTIRPKGPLFKNFGSTSSLSPGDVTRVKALYCSYLLTLSSWTEWSVWSSCSVTCNTGVKNRTRICRKPDNSHVCPGSNFEVTRCYKYPCLVLAHWGKWGAWNKCSATCDGGRQVRARQCTGGDVCTKAKGRQFRSCGRNKCPGSLWYGWSQWSPCSKSCNYGMTTQRRRCSGTNCVGVNTKTKICNYNIRCTPVWGQWSNWTVCTEGKVTRTRSCRLLPYKCRGPHTESLDCPENGSRVSIPLTTSGQLVTTAAWTTWSPCNTCDTKNQERRNTCGILGECRQVRRCQISPRCPKV